MSSQGIDIVDSRLDKTAQLEQIIASTTDWLWEVDKDGFYSYSSPQVESLLGYSPDEVIGLTPFDLMPKGEADKVRSQYSLIVEKRKPFQFLQNYNLHKNGTLVLLETSGSPFFDEAGNFAGYRGIDRDITSRQDVILSDHVYESLLNCVTDATIVSDTNGVVTHVNKHFTNLFGYSFNEIVGKEIFILNPPDIDYLSSIESSIEQMVDGEFHTSVRERKKKNGELLTVMCNASPIKNSNNKVIQYVCSYHDLSESLNYEKELNRNSNLLEQSQRLASVGGWELDIESGELFWTAETYRLFETSPDRFNPTVDAVVDSYLPESRRKLSEALEAAINKGQGYDLILEILTTKGNLLNIRTNCEVFHKDGVPFKLSGAVQDISEYVAVQKQLNETILENSLAIDTAKLGVWTFDLASQKLQWSDMQLAIFGLSREDYDESLATFESMLHPEDKEQVQAKFAEVLNGNSILDVNFRIVLPGNEIRHINGSATPVYDADSNMKGAIGINRDVSELREKENSITDYINRLDKALDGSIELAMNLNSLRDPYTSGHEERVSKIATQIGTIMGLENNIVRGLTEGGKLHDIGKFVVPVEILSKPGQLNEFEYQLIQSHSQQGYEVLKNIDFPWPIAEMAHQHHERLDGSGYPRGLKGDEIILEARILAVADVVEAMSSHRPYRASLGIDHALNEIEKGRGKLYDEKVVDACLKLFREQGFTISEASI